jgi:hypothetical protein
MFLITKCLRTLQLKKSYVALFRLYIIDLSAGNLEPCNRSIECLVHVANAVPVTTGRNSWVPKVWESPSSSWMRRALDRRISALSAWSNKHVNYCPFLILRVVWLGQCSDKIVITQNTNLKNIITDARKQHALNWNFVSFFQKTFIVH